MTVFIRGLIQFVGDIAYDVATLEALLADMRRIAKGEFPTASELLTAPVIDNYSVGARRARACWAPLAGRTSRRATTRTPRSCGCWPSRTAGLGR